MLSKHIDLVERRIIKGETIPHEEKLFSIFETYTEWITKGKLHPNVELGKKVLVCTDQYHLIVDHRVLDHQSDQEVLIPLADRLLNKFNIESLSTDKGFWNKENKEILKEYIPKVIMPKRGKLTQEEKHEEHAPMFKRSKNLHSAVESNINELEHRGLDRCHDRGYGHYKRYVGLAVCAYNLCKIGRELAKQQRQKQEKLKT